MPDPVSPLVELKQVHKALLDAVQAFETMLQRRAPDPALLSRTRLQFSLINGRRHVLLDRICGANHDLPRPELDRLRQMRAERAGTQARMSELIARWSARKVMGNWPGYVADCATFPRIVRENIAEEQAVLYPLLARPLSVRAA